VTPPATYAALLRELEHDEAVPCQEFLLLEGVSSRDSHAVVELARERGSQLSSLGLVAGDRVGIIVTEPGEFLPLVHGCLLFGLVAVPMYPPPPFSRLDTYRDTLTGILRAAGAKVVVADNGLPARLGGIAAQQVIELNELTAAANVAAPDVEPAALALLQFTSGSTSEPKGVQISHRALMANAHAIMVEGLTATQSDRGVSWLPLYHDMGLIGFGLAPLLTRTPVTFIPTARFVRNPAVWLQTLSMTRATITFAPNFAYALAAKRIAPKDLDLSQVRMWGCGAEPIAERVLSDFERQFTVSGVRPGTVSPCYGLAEATLAVTFTAPGGPRVVHALDAAKWESEGVAHLDSASAAGLEGASTTLAVSCGTPLPGYAITVVDEAGNDVGELRAGEVVVRGPSLGDGYAGNTGASVSTFRDQCLHTGDRGFVHDGQLFVTGRIKDTLIVNGRKYDPQVLEHWAEQVAGVRRAAAVNVDSHLGETIVVLVECASEERIQLAEEVRAQLAARVGVAVARVVLIALGALPRTTSGKLRRHAAIALAKV
jgi:fatty-acyl-CoA synthase